MYTQRSLSLLFRSLLRYNTNKPLYTQKSLSLLFSQPSTNGCNGLLGEVHPKQHDRLNLSRR